MSQLTLRTSKTCAASIGGAAKSVCGQAEAKGKITTLRKEREGWGTRLRACAGEAEADGEIPHPSQKTLRMGHPQRRKANLEAKRKAKRKGTSEK